MLLKVKDSRDIRREVLICDCGKLFVTPKTLSNSEKTMLCYNCMTHQKVLNRFHDITFDNAIDNGIIVPKYSSGRTFSATLEFRSGSRLLGFYPSFKEAVQVKVLAEIVRAMYYCGKVNIYKCNELFDMITEKPFSARSWNLINSIGDTCRR